MQTILQDLRYGARMLLKRPGFTLIAVLTLAIGIGATTAIFSVVNTVLLKPTPYHDPERIVQIIQQRQGKRIVQFAPAQFVELRRQNDVFETVAATQFFDANLGGGETPERVRGVRVNAGAFNLLGINPLLGRWPQESEDHPGGEPVVIIGHRLWQERFGADPEIIGKAVRVNSGDYSVIGVMPEGFRFPAPYWAPGELWALSGQGGVNWNQEKPFSLLAFGRMKDGVNPAQAQAEMDVIAGRLAEKYPGTNTGSEIRLTAYGGTSAAASRSKLLPLFAAAGLVLLIACVNVVNLLLSRGLDRRRELAIRAALGAGRGRLARQMLTESMLLFLAGGALGLLVAMWGVELIVSLRSFDIPRMEEATIDRTVAGFSLLISFVAGIAAGIFPAFQHSEIKVVETLNEGGRSGGHGGRWRHFQKALIVTETALTLILLVGAGLLARSYHQLSTINPGFEVENLWSMRTTLPITKYKTNQQRADFYREATERISGLPSVVAACAVDVPPGVGAGAEIPYILSDETGRDYENDKRLIAHRLISPDYFRTLEAPVKEGRAFTPADQTGRPQVVIINETLAHQAFPEQSALGQRLRLPFYEPEGQEPESWEIVGVVADLKEEYVSKPAPPTIYLPMAQRPLSSAALLVREAKGAPDVISAIRRELTALDPDQPVYGIRAMAVMLESEFDLQWLSLVLLGSFAAISLALALTGIFGVVAYSVSQRTREIGIRLALGATAGNILRLIFREGLLLVALGVALGTGGAYAATKFITSQLYGVSATDLPTFFIAAVLLVMVTLFACWIPARRATKVDPMEALRYE